MEACTSQGVNLPGSDLTIISCDGIEFHVHKARLANASEVFNDMLEIGSTESNEVTLVEPTTLLARLLPVAYPHVIPPYKVKLLRDMSLLKAFKKYQLARGIESIALSLQAAVSQTPPAPNLDFAVLATETAAELGEGFGELLSQWANTIVPFTSKKQTSEFKKLILSVPGVDPDFALKLVSKFNSDLFGNFGSELAKLSSSSIEDWSTTNSTSKP
ncbi:hypothetical protein P7C70_g4270, partial [Phenoliferia sp. Uapishka_3]